MPLDLSAVPEPQRPIVAAALDEAFPLGGIDELSPAPLGASGASTYRVRRRDGDVLLRIEGDRMPGRNPHQYQNLRAASDAGIAPPVRLLDEESGVMAMEWIDVRPLSDHPGGPVGLAQSVGELLAEVQQLDPFPPREDWAEGISMLLAYLAATGRFLPGALDRHVAAWERIRAGWARDPDAFVPAHNDPNALNILFDGARIWLVDWETSGQNDPLVDLAIAGNQLATSPELVDVLLTAWSGSPPDDRVRGRLVVAQQAAKLWAAAALAAITAGDGPSDLTAPSMEQFMAGVATGEIVMTEPSGLATFSKVVFEEFLAGASTPEFDRALVLAGD